MQKILSTVTIAFVLFSGVLAAHADETSPSPLPKVSAVLPDLTPPDLSSAGDLANTPVKLPRAAQNALSPTLVWMCSSPRNLASDATATVRACSYVAIGGGK